jgi:hypothetical protein
LVAIHHTYTHISVAVADWGLLLYTNFGQHSYCFRHLCDSFKIEIANYELISFGAAFSGDAIRKELHCLIGVACLVYMLNVEQTSQNFTNGKVSKLFSSHDQHLTA